MPKAQRFVAVSIPLDCSVSRNWKKSSQLCFESGALTTLKHQLDAQMSLKKGDVSFASLAFTLHISLLP